MNPLGIAGFSKILRLRSVSNLFGDEAVLYDLLNALFLAIVRKTMSLALVKKLKLKRGRLQTEILGACLLEIARLNSRQASLVYYQLVWVHYLVCGQWVNVCLLTNLGQMLVSMGIFMLFHQLLLFYTI